MFISEQDLENRVSRGEAFRAIIGSGDSSLSVRSEVPPTPEWTIGPVLDPVLPVPPDKNEARASAVIDSLLMGRETAALIHGVTPSTLGKWEQGQVTGRANPVQALIDEIEQKKSQVRDTAFEKLAASLDIIDEDLLKRAKGPLEAASVASQLSRVVDKMMPKELQDEGDRHVHFHIMQPAVKRESDYLTVEV